MRRDEILIMSQSDQLFAWDQYLGITAHSLAEL
jgi:hypothetical protein